MGTENEFKEMTDEICPLCGDPLIQLYGCGWDYDRLICSRYGCDYDLEFEGTSYPEEDDN